MNKQIIIEPQPDKSKEIENILAVVVHSCYNDTDKKVVCKKIDNAIDKLSQLIPDRKKIINPDYSDGNRCNRCNYPLTNKYPFTVCEECWDKPQQGEVIQGLVECDNTTVRVGGINIDAKLYGDYFGEEITIELTPK